MKQPTTNLEDFKVEKVSKSKTTKKKKSNAKTDIDKQNEYTIEKFQGYLIKDVPLGESYVIWVVLLIKNIFMKSIMILKISLDFLQK